MDGVNDGKGNGPVSGVSSPAEDGGGFPFKAVVIAGIAGTGAVSAYFVGSIIGSLAKWVTRIAIGWMVWTGCSKIYHMENKSLKDRCLDWQKQIENLDIKSALSKINAFIRSYFSRPSDAGGDDGGETKKADSDDTDK